MKWMLLALTVLLASCTTVTKMGPGSVVVKEQLVAKLDSAWNRIDVLNRGKAELWTTDGMTLDNLAFYVGVAEGEELAPMTNRQEKQQVRFRTSMQAHEIVELYGALASEGGNSFKLDKLTPSTFLNGDGFRFEFTLLRKTDEVELKGLAYGAVRAGKLHLMVFRAPRLHYFSRHLARVEAIARTLKLQGQG
jgi:hypothetical protein